MSDGFRSRTGFWVGGLGEPGQIAVAGWRSRVGFWFGGLCAPGVAGPVLLGGDDAWRKQRRPFTAEEDAERRSKWADEVIEREEMRTLVRRAMGYAEPVATPVDVAALVVDTDGIWAKIEALQGALSETQRRLVAEELRLIEEDEEEAILLLLS